MRKVCESTYICPLQHTCVSFNPRSEQHCRVARRLTCLFFSNKKQSGHLQMKWLCRNITLSHLAGCNMNVFVDIAIYNFPFTIGGSFLMWNESMLKYFTNGFNINRCGLNRTSICMCMTICTLMRAFWVWVFSWSCKTSCNLYGYIE